MATRTNESMEKINKRDMINIVLSLQSKLDEANKHVVEEIRKLSDAILKLQAELQYNTYQKHLSKTLVRILFKRYLFKIILSITKLKLTKKI